MKGQQVLIDAAQTVVEDAAERGAEELRAVLSGGDAGEERSGARRVFAQTTDDHEIARPHDRPVLCDAGVKADPDLAEALFGLDERAIETVPRT